MIIKDRSQDFSVTQHGKCSVCCNYDSCYTYYMIEHPELLNCLEYRRQQYGSTRAKTSNQRKDNT